MKKHKEFILEQIEIKCPRCGVYVNSVLNRQGEIVCPVCGQSLETEVKEYLEEENPEALRLFFV